MPQHILDDPDVLRPSLDLLLEFAQVVAQHLHFALVELYGVGGGLLDVVAGSDVDEDVRGGGECPRDVERGREWDQDRFA